MGSLEILFQEIESLHNSEPCHDESEIDHFEKQIGYQLPTDLKLFYKKFKSVCLFDNQFSSTYRIVPITEIHSTRIDIYGIDKDEYGPATWLTICDVMDGNYVGIDILSIEADECNFIDCFHESFAQPGDSKIIAKSFTEFLDHALHNGEDLFYLQTGFVGYGDAFPKSPESSISRIENSEDSQKG
ncbi:MAG: hypothetical protein C0410_06495 [Anaerolinea sp.]|nr:hypothetical protein [Anaerolinea sp.]